MATVISGSKIKLNDGKTIIAEQGGWYDGQQFWNDTLSAPNVINKYSDQQGAGQAVSAEVRAQSAKAQGVSPQQFDSYLVAQTARYEKEQADQAVATDRISKLNSGNLSSYLGDFQDSMFNSNAGDLALALKPSTPAPTPINRVEMLQEQRAAMGVEELETELNQIKEQERLIQATTRANQVNEEGKPVALGVIAGRVTEEQRQAQMDLDFLNVRKATLVDELQTKYNSINMYINLAGLDYQDARQAYESDFSRNLEMAKFISSEKQNAITNAKANLTTLMNAITSGNLSYGQLSSDEQVQIMKLEMQAGLPVGTMGRLQMSPSDRMLGFSDDKTQVMMLDGNGNFVVQSTGFAPSTKAASEVELKRSVSSTITSAFNSVKGGDGFVDPADYQDMRSYWVSQTGSTTEEFDKMFAMTYVNPTHPQSYDVAKEFRDPNYYN